MDIIAELRMSLVEEVQCDQLWHQFHPESTWVQSWPVATVGHLLILSPEQIHHHIHGPEVAMHGVAVTKWSFTQHQGIK